ncbi:MAG: nucleotide sugar dehydrogenase, partial [Owenweeksia sp.]
MDKNFSNPRVGIIGLGYVGLPLAVEFAKKFPTVGFDINKPRVQELNSGHDHTLEVEDDLLKSVLVTEQGDKGLLVTDQRDVLAGCNIYIVTVPTPTDKHNRPVLTPLVKASETVGAVLNDGDIVIYESTVYPG